MSKANWSQSPTEATHFLNGRFYKVDGKSVYFWTIDSWVFHGDSRMFSVKPGVEKRN